MIALNRKIKKQQQLYKQKRNYPDILYLYVSEGHKLHTITQFSKCMGIFAQESNCVLLGSGENRRANILFCLVFHMTFGPDIILYALL